MAEDIEFQTNQKKRLIEEDKFNVAKLQFEEEIVDLKAKLKRYEEGYNQSQNLIKEYDTLINYLPLRGEFFCCGKIEKSALVGDSYSMNFSIVFNEIPKVMICALYPKMIKIDNGFITVRQNGFDLRCDKGLPKLVDGGCYFWMAYLPIRAKSDKITQLIDLMKGVKVVSEKELESRISKYLKKYDVNDEDSLGRTLLSCACEKSYRYLVEFLISKGANVNCCDENRYSPLHKALTADTIDIEIVKMLLEHRADRTFKNERMNTPLHYLCRNGKLKELRDVLMLLLNGMTKEDMTRYINEANSSGETALTNVCANSMDLESIKILLDRGADVNHQTNAGIFPLYSAVMKGNTDSMEMLLKYGANIGTKYKNKPLSQVAEERGQMEKLMQIIREKYASKTMSEDKIAELADRFENDPLPTEVWTDNLMKSKPLFVDVDTFEIGMNVENYFTCTTHRYDILLQSNIHDCQLASCYYKKHYKPDDHNNYIIHTDTDLAIVSISDDKRKKVIVRNKRNDIRKIYENKTDQQIIKELFPEYKEKSLVSVRGAPIFHALCRFEQNFTYNTYKFGVLYAAPGQTKEYELYNNMHGSVYFEQFLELLGYKFELFGLQQYAGGLDTKGMTTGEHTIINSFSHNNISIAFHVSTYLPFNDQDPQQYERRKFIGNDHVVIIFKEYHSVPEMFDMSSFKSPNNLCFIIVGFDVNQKNPPNKYEYSVNIVCKKDISPVPPFITTDRYQHDTNGFSQFLTAKLINAERAVHDSLQFRAKKLTIRQNQLESIMNNFARRNN